MSKYSKDKERMDKIAYKIQYREPIKEWVAMYWIAVAVGHILEWIVKQPAVKDIQLIEWLEESKK